MRQQGEASVEEILDSIKKVIARDNRDGAIEERRRRSNAGVVDGDAAEMNSAHDEIPEPASGEEAEEILDLSNAQLIDDDTADLSSAESQNDTDASGHAPLADDIMTASVRENLAALAMMAQPGAQPKIVTSGETSLEGLAREMLRPMLAEWLEANLPQMVERMVQTEIARIAGKRS